MIGFSVAGICLWGTVVGSMLPLVFDRFGIDPGIASSPFVATFVDVTGIVIYFSIAGILWATYYFNFANNKKASARITLQRLFVGILQPIK